MLGNCGGLNPFIAPLGIPLPDRTKHARATTEVNIRYFMTYFYARISTIVSGML